MKKLWQKIGNLAFWLSYPLLQVYLRIGWRTRVLVIHEEHLLVVKGWLGNGRQWQLPGGGVHHGEPHAEAACREVFEETGVKAKPNDLKLLYQDRSRQHGLSVRYSCYALIMQTRAAVQKQAIEITEIAWLPLLEITKANATKETYQAVQTWLQQ